MVLYIGNNTIACGIVFVRLAPIIKKLREKRRHDRIIRPMVAKPEDNLPLIRKYGTKIHPRMLRKPRLQVSIRIPTRTLGSRGNFGSIDTSPKYHLRRCFQKSPMECGDKIDISVLDLKNLVPSAAFIPNSASSAMLVMSFQYCFKISPLTNIPSPCIPNTGFPK